MKPCPFCAEEIQDAAIRCKHCRSDLAASSPTVDDASPGAARRRSARKLAAGVFALVAVAIGAPVIARPIMRHYRIGTCQPSSWMEWHVAMRRHCLDPSYVCDHMTTAKLLEDPDVAESFGASAGQLADMVGRMRKTYGCAPESGPAFHPDFGRIVPPAFPPSQDAPRSL